MRRCRRHGRTRPMPMPPSPPSPPPNLLLPAATRHPLSTTSLRALPPPRGAGAALLLRLLLLASAAAPAAAGETNSTSSSDDGGGSSGHEIVIVALIITVLLAISIFLYIWYSRNESRNRLRKEAEEQEMLERKEQESPPQPPRRAASPPPLPPPQPWAPSPPAQGGASATTGTPHGNPLRSPLSSAVSYPSHLHGTRGPLSVPLPPPSSSLQRLSSTMTASTYFNHRDMDGMPLEVGSIVVGRKGATWERGRIVKDNGDGTVTLQYDDGDFDVRLDPMTVYSAGDFEIGDPIEHLPSSTPGFITRYGDRPSTYSVRLLADSNTSTLTDGPREQMLDSVHARSLKRRSIGGLSSFALSDVHDRSTGAGASTGGGTGGGGGGVAGNSDRGRYKVGDRVAARENGPGSAARQGVITAVYECGGGDDGCLYHVLFNDGHTSRGVEERCILPMSPGDRAISDAATTLGATSSFRARGDTRSQATGGIAGSRRSVMGLPRSKTAVSKDRSDFMLQAESSVTSGVPALEALVGLHNAAVTPVTPRTPSLHKFPVRGGGGGGGGDRSDLLARSWSRTSTRSKGGTPRVQGDPHGLSFASF